MLGILTNSGHFKDTNPAWHRTLGWQPAEIHSREFIHFVHPDDIPQTNEAFEEIQRGQPVLGFENRYQHKDGSYRWLSWNAIPDGDLYHCSARDITEAKENASALKTKDQEIQLREQFMAVLSHDLRNPLAALGSAVRLLRREPQSDAATDILGLADTSIVRMENLISDVMDFTRASLGTGLTLNFSKELKLKAALEHTVDEIRLIHTGATINTELNFTEPVGCDHGRICQVVSNLVSNAVAYGAPSKPITLTAKDFANQFQMTVRNHGSAIPKQAIPKLFQPFIRDDNRNSQQGLGLGLYICSEIAKAHGGTLTVTSNDDETVFTYLMKRDTGQAS